MPISQNQNRSNYQKRKRAGLILVCAAFVLAVIMRLLATALSPIPEELAWIIGPWRYVLLAVPALFLVLSPFLAFRRKKKQTNEAMTRIQDELLAHPEQAAAFADKKLRTLRALRLGSLAETVLLFICGLLLPLVFSLTTSDDAVNASAGMVIFGGFVLVGALSRLRLCFRYQAEQKSQGGFAVSREDLPLLYGMAEKALSKAGLDRTPALFLTPDNSFSFEEEKGALKLVLGTALLRSLDREELEQLLFYEACSLKQEQKGLTAENRYHQWLATGATPMGPFAGIALVFYLYADQRYLRDYRLFSYARTLSADEALSRKIREEGDPAPVCSALRKQRYYGYFSWERQIQDQPSLFEKEKPDKAAVYREADLFLEALPRREAEWQALLQREIQSRNTDQPIARTRIEALDAPAEAPAAAAGPDPRFSGEIMRAVDLTAEGFTEGLKAMDYEAARQELYLEPLSRIGAWEEAGKPLDQENCSGIIDDLRKLGRHQEAEKLADALLSAYGVSSAGAYALLIKGLFRLHRYDDRGIFQLYNAATVSKRFAGEAMDLVGSYCCISGNQPELDRYRRLAPNMGKQARDLFSETRLLRCTDCLSSETELPGKCREELTALLTELRPQGIREAFLFRKTVTETYFFSALVLRYEEQLTEDEREALQERVYRYLLSVEDWQFGVFDADDVRDVPYQELEDVELIGA